MHSIRIFLLSFVFLSLLADDSSEQQDPNDSFKHLDPGIAVLRNKTVTFSSEFCSFILEAAPQEVKDKLALLKDPYCPSWLIPKKILLYGPSGSGKTTLAQVIAQELDRPFIYISAGLLGNEYKNSVAQNLRRAIEPYKDKLCVVIIDEIDCILKKATNDKDLDQHTPKQVWEIIDLCAKLPNVLVIGITNSVGGMDEPLQTRFAGDTVEVPLLNSLEMRKKTILFHLQAFMSDLNDSYITSLAKKTKKFSHRELEKLVIAAMTSAYLNKKLVPIVCKDDFEKAYKQMEKSRSLLNKINWADYEKHLQYGIQIAGLVVNIASLVTNWRMSWLNYLATQKNQSENINNQNRIHEDAKKHQDQLASINREHSEKINNINMENSNTNFQISTTQSQANADRSDLRAQEKAQSFYEAIRKSSADIKKIANNTGIPEQIIEKIKNHVFYDQHLLDSGLSRFSPDIDMADAWQRLIDGNFVHSDLILLQHELIESSVLSNRNITARLGHELTNEVCNWEKSLSI